MRTLKRTALLVASASAVALSACAGTTASRSVTYHHVGTPELFTYAAAGRDMRTVIRGNPTEAPQPEFERAVISAMQGSTWGAETRFTTTPSPGAREGYRVVLVFSGPPGIDGQAACAEPEEAGLAPAQSQVELQAAFCYHERVLSEARVRTSSIASPGDARLAAAVRQAMVSLIPARVPERRPQGDRDPFPTP